MFHVKSYHNIKNLEIKGDIDCYITFGDFKSISVISHNVELFEIKDECTDQLLNLEILNNKNDKNRYLVIHAPILDFFNITDTKCYCSNFNKTEFFTIKELKNIRIFGEGLLQAKNIINESNDLFINIKGKSKIIVDEIIVPYKRTQLVLESSSELLLNEEKPSYFKNCKLYESRKEVERTYLNNIYFYDLKLKVKEKLNFNLNIGNSFDFNGNVNSLIHLNLYGDYCVINKNIHKSKQLITYIKGDYSGRDEAFANIAEMNFSLTNKIEEKPIDTYVKLNYRPILSMNQFVDYERIKEIELVGKVILNCEPEIRNNLILNNVYNKDINYSLSDNKLKIINHSDSPIDIEFRGILDNLKSISLSDESHLFLNNSSDIKNIENIKTKNANLYIYSVCFHNLNMDITDSLIKIKKAHGEQLILNNDNSKLDITETGFIKSMIFNGVNKQRTTISDCFVRTASIDIESGGLFLFCEHYKYKNKEGKIFVYQVHTNNEKSLTNNYIFKETQKISLKHNYIYKESANQKQKDLYDELYKGKNFVLKLLEEEYPTELINKSNRELLKDGFLWIDKKDIKSFGKLKRAKYETLVNIYGSSIRVKGTARF